MNNEGSRCQNVCAATPNIGVSLAQLTSSRSQRHEAWVGVGGGQRIGTGQFSHEAFHKKTSGCPAGWVPPMLSRESTLGFVFLVPCFFFFSEQHKTGGKNSLGRNTTFFYSLKVWEVLMRNRTSWSGQTHFSLCTAQKGPWSSGGGRRVMKVFEAPTERTLLALASKILGFKFSASTR